jgi:hypothetical protein
VAVGDDVCEIDQPGTARGLPRELTREGGTGVPVRRRSRLLQPPLQVAADGAPADGPLVVVRLVERIGDAEDAEVAGLSCRRHDLVGQGQIVPDGKDLDRPSRGLLKFPLADAHLHVQVDRRQVGRWVGVGMTAHRPTAIQQEPQLLGRHVEHLPHRRAAFEPLRAEVAAHGADVAGDAVLLVNGVGVHDGVDGGLVVRDGVHERGVVLPWRDLNADFPGHLPFSP